MSEHFIYLFIFLYYIRMEPANQNNNINVTQLTRQLFNVLRSNLPREEINRIRNKLNKKRIYV